MTEAEKIRWFRQVSKSITARCLDAGANLQWLQEQMHPYLSVTMHDEAEAIGSLAIQMPYLKRNKRLVLRDTDKTLILARLNQPGSLYRTLRLLREREISYAQFTHSYAPVPGIGEELELQRFEFDRRTAEEVLNAGEVRIPKRLHREIRTALKAHYPDYDFSRFDKELRLVWINNETYVRHSPPRRVAQILWLYHQAVQSGGVFFDAEPAEEILDQPEYRILFAAGNPPQLDFLQQVMEVYNRLGLGIKRSYCLTIHNGIHPYFLGTFYLRGGGKTLLTRDGFLYNQLEQELFNTQILSTASESYQRFVATGSMNGIDAALVNAFAGFCHTTLAHNQPDRFGYEEVERAFTSDLEMTLRLVALFRTRFEPQLPDRDEHYRRECAELKQAISDYNTGHAYLDGIRRTVFNCCLLFITHTLKTNFFVNEKHALAFRLDPGYLDRLGPEFTADLPPERPFRVTFFYGRHGCGYHIGFSDIARGGWRTVLAKNRDDFITSANTLFRENYVLAHTQHLKNKDIYEGGSKMVVALDAADLDNPETVTRRLYKLQYGFIQAFLDIFVTEDGKARDPRVVDYYGEDEPIELGPDENMHDEMVELIARISAKRGYLLGPGVMSSKRFGINHKEYGVTSTGVITFAEITLQQLGIDMRKDAFSVKLTGGPGGDVAGNGLRLLLERCPQVQIRLILDGSGALVDPAGADREALAQVVLKSDIDGFDPQALHDGGMMIFRSQTKKDGLRELYRKVSRTDGELVEEWITVDEFYREFNSLVFKVEADLFIPAGGRPETIHAGNWQQFLPGGTPSARAIIEGANSFITPEAREKLQAEGIIIMRDASANKCGVISSSYEIIANLLLTEKEFFANKDAYVGDVLEILEKRAADEARLIFRRYDEYSGSRSYTDISAGLSREINEHYARLFRYFQDRPELASRPLYRRALLAHLPRILRETPRYRKRIGSLPPKYQAAILASEIASSLVYQQDREADYEQMLNGHLQRHFSA
ncbi:NAD-glutamate dehydrogenase domain-containing protein [Geothermobacter hydrogeniphilus]|uniref:Amino acid dehydrogenase n=1 Tax=Geothermobacter hydrogeniphilus TaxID=1969733 RepID=A0A1X0XXE4_9BACT|nr:NAD-glutamate dehydrogenase domain-containing protein [Geothermobacter hydrogeniphilus]ORJ57590.1 amino acid dehydrogenase [Geothermobacter hydrogeniphilus]